MTRSSLINKISTRFPEMSQRDVEKTVKIIFDQITTSLIKGQRVELRGFGAFSVRYREKRTGRNPRTGDQVQVDSKYVPFFKTGKALRQKLNNPKK